MPPNTSQLHTIRDWLRFTVSQFEANNIFFGHGTDNSYDEAVWLVMSALHLPHDTLHNFLDANITEPERKHLAHLIQQRVTKRVPTAYLLREAWLRGFKFYVDERVIVPRSFIAELLDFNEDGEHGLQPWIEHPELINSAVDICTGSGCLAVLMAHAYPAADIDAVDLSADALTVAQRNVLDYGLADRINLLRSDLFANLRDKRYDVIISNPPYVTAVAMSDLPPEHRHEPNLALAGGDDGLDHVRSILNDAPRFLNPGGTLVVEVGNNRSATEIAFPQVPFVWLETATSPDSVFLLKREDLVAAV